MQKDHQVLLLSEWFLQGLDPWPWRHWHHTLMGRCTKPKISNKIEYHILKRTKATLSQLWSTILLETQNIPSAYIGLIRNYTRKPSCVASCPGIFFLLLSLVTVHLLPCLKSLLLLLLLLSIPLWWSRHLLPAHRAISLPFGALLKDVSN